MNTNMTGFRCFFNKSLHAYAFEKSSLSIGRVKGGSCTLLSPVFQDCRKTAHHGSDRFEGAGRVHDSDSGVEWGDIPSCCARATPVGCLGSSCQPANEAWRETLEELLGSYIHVTS